MTDFPGTSEKQTHVERMEGAIRRVESLIGTLDSLIYDIKNDEHRACVAGMEEQRFASLEQMLQAAPDSLRDIVGTCEKRVEQIKTILFNR